MAISLWELRSDLSLNYAASSTEGITRSSVNYLHKRKANTRMIYYVVNWMKTLVDSFFFSLRPLCLIVYLLSAFLYSKPFWNNWMHCEIIDRYFNVFFVKIQLKKENLDAQTGIPVSQTAWVCHCWMELLSFHFNGKLITLAEVVMMPFRSSFVLTVDLIYFYLSYRL